MNKHEAKFQSKISKVFTNLKWMKKYFPVPRFPYELKASTGKTVPFSKFQDQQIPSLERAWRSCHAHKMTDASLGIKPYDGFVYCESDAYVGIMYEMPQNQTECYFIHIEHVLKIKQNKRSITKDDAIKYGIKIVL